MILKQPALKVHMNVKILDTDFINIESIKDEFKNNSTLKLSIFDGKTDSLEDGGFIRSLKINVPTIRLLQEGKRYEKFDIVFSLGKFSSVFILAVRHELNIIYLSTEKEDGETKVDDPLKIEDGHFQFYFHTAGLPSFPKRIVFVLDVSSSMEGIQINQTKDSVITILQSLNKNVSRTYYNNWVSGIAQFKL